MNRGDLKTWSRKRLETELLRLDRLVNTPHTESFLEAVRAEAAHQRLRWGDEHDLLKSPQDWFWLLGFLGGKAIRPGITKTKRLHHIITTAAALMNWHRIETTSSNSDQECGTCEACRLGERCCTNPKAPSSSSYDKVWITQWHGSGKAAIQFEDINRSDRRIDCIDSAALDLVHKMLEAEGYDVIRVDHQT